VPGRVGLPRAQNATHVAFCDPSGGSSDSFALAVAHGEDRSGSRVAVLDYLAERRPPFSPDAVVAEYAAALKDYGVTRVQSDKYAGAWVVEAFGKHGITCEQSAEPKSTIYANVLPLLNSGRVELLDYPRLQAQMLSLERRTARGGRDSIDHPPNGHDDLANAAAGALVAAGGQGEPGMLGYVAMLHRRMEEGKDPWGSESLTAGRYAPWSAVSSYTLIGDAVGAATRARLPHFGMGQRTVDQVDELLTVSALNTGPEMNGSNFSRVQR